MGGAIPPILLPPKGEEDGLSELVGGGEIFPLGGDVGAYLKDQLDKEDKEVGINPNMDSLGYCQWMSGDNKTWRPASKTSPLLTPGLYDIIVDIQGNIHFKQISLKTEGLLRLPDSNGDAVVDEIHGFWDKAALFKEFKLTHKRGILFHGPPGSGKSCTIQLILNDVIKRGGIAINFTQVSLYVMGMRVFRDIQPTTPVVVLLEDIDAILSRNGESHLLNVLDGAESFEHVVYLASTNYPEMLSPRIQNRPSRFDKKVEIKAPSPAARRTYLDWVRKDVVIDLDKWVEDTDGFSLAHLKELFIATQLMGAPYESTLLTLREMGYLEGRGNTAGLVGGGKKRQEQIHFMGVGFGG